MQVKVFDNEEDYFKFRQDYFTSSEIIRLMAEPTKKQKEKGVKLSDGAITYILETICNVESEPKPQFYNSEMQWGNDTEPQAAFELCQLLGLDITSSEVIYTSKNGKVFYHNAKSGGTPDQIFLGLKAISEIKCPNSATHLYYKMFVNAENFKEELPKYYCQMQHNMYLTESDFCYFFSFDPRFKKQELQKHLIKIEKDQDYLNEVFSKIDLAYDFKQRILKTI
jgi:hypothetical protein